MQVFKGKHWCNNKKFRNSKTRSDQLKTKKMCTNAVEKLKSCRP